MRHRKKTVKLGRTAAHRDALLANQVVSLIEHERITTTLAKAKAVRPLAEKMVTLGKRGDLHARRVAVGYLGRKEAVKKLFETVAPRAAERAGGYTRIVKLGQRPSDSAPMASIEWVDLAIATPEPAAEKAPAKKARAASSKTAEPAAPEATADKPAKESRPRAKKSAPAAESSD
jgi:large subunit ribosomal protein L17